MVTQWNRRPASALLLAKGVLFVLLAGSVAIGNTAVHSQVEVILDLPYGSGENAVGALRGQNGPPVCPEMFQMMNDHILWVLDTVNSRIMAFKDGKQTAEISTVEYVKFPSLFGVTQKAILIAKIINNGAGPVFTFQQYDIHGMKWDAKKVDLPERIRFTPLSIKPYGINGEGLIVDILGNQFQGDIETNVVVNSDGQVIGIISDADAVPGTDGSIWRVRLLDGTREVELPFAIDKYNVEENRWQSSTEGAVPRSAERYKLEKEARVRPIGVDDYGRMTVIVYEGMPPSPRFIHIDGNGNVESDFRLEDLNFDPKPLTRYFAAECYQLLPDDSILALYASPDRFKIVRIYDKIDKSPTGEAQGEK